MGNRWDGEVEEERRSEAESEVDLAGMISELTRECSLLVFSFALQIILLYEALRKRFVDLLTSTTSVEYVKLIVSCLDYSADDGLTRVVLQTALTSTNEAGRKWSTRFLGVIAGHELQGFAEWGMSLLLAQLSDHSAKVVRHAIRLLHRWMPFYPESISLLKNVRLDALGDAGIMLKTHLFANEDYVGSNPNDVQVAFNLWRKEFNARYVEVIDEDLKVAMLNVKRSLDGRFARISNDKSLRQSVPLPVHFYGQMALHLTGQQMLSKSGEVERLLDYLRRWSVSVETSQLRNIKGAILALAHIAGSRSPDCSGHLSLCGTMSDIERAWCCILGNEFNRQQ
uniref:RICTOR_V domain-containing protein n=1 Tax=Ascaris lumbricoides TaxID=6252 RepID=A0A0M3HPI4_ASCLU